MQTSGVSASRDREGISNLAALGLAARSDSGGSFELLMILEIRFVVPDFSAETLRGRRLVGALWQ